MSPSPSSDRWLLPALFAVGAAIINVVVWYVFDQLVGGPREFGWPFNNPLSIALLGGVGGGLVGRAYHRHRQLRRLAAEDPVEPIPLATPTSESDGAELPDLPAFARRIRVERRSTVRVGTVSADLFDLTTEASDGDGGTIHITRTFVLLPAHGLPAFELHPHRSVSHFLAWAGADGIRFDPTALETAEASEVVQRFEAMYRLAAVSTDAILAGVASGGDDAAIRRVFTLGTLRVAVGRDDWRVQSHRGYVAFWIGPESLGPQRRATLVEDVVTLYTALRAAHADSIGDPVLSAPPGAISSERQSARLQAAVLGAVLGGFAGFFVGGVLSAVDFFAQPPGGRVPNGDGGRILAAVAFGVLGGGTVGRLLPLRRPLLRKPTDPRREKVVGCAVGVGLFGGFFAGFAAGAILKHLLDWKIGDGGEVLIFGGMGVGALAGPILLGVATNLIYKWITGQRD